MQLLCRNLIPGFELWWIDYFCRPHDCKKKCPSLSTLGSATRLDYFFKDFGYKFSHKSSPNIWGAVLKNDNFNGYFWGNLGFNKYCDKGLWLRRYWSSCWKPKQRYDTDIVHFRSSKPSTPKAKSFGSSLPNRKCFVSVIKMARLCVQYLCVKNNKISPIAYNVCQSRLKILPSINSQQWPSLSNVAKICQIWSPSISFNVNHSIAELTVPNEHPLGN